MLVVVTKYRTFYHLKTTNNKKIILNKTEKEPWLKEGIDILTDNQLSEINYISDKEINKNSENNIEIMNYLEDNKYDELLTSSILFLNLTDTSANNLVVEAINMSIPLLINKHPAVVEYLGNDYPFYYKDMEEANKLVDDDAKIEETHQYLENMDKYFLSMEYFIKSIINLDINKRQTEYNLGDQYKLDYGIHRSGWSYVLKNLNNYIMPKKNSIYLDTFVERTFVWNCKDNPDTFIYKNPWIGIIHNPENIPYWFQYNQSFNALLKKKNFLYSLKTCKKLLTLSNSNAKYLRENKIIKKLNIPVDVFYHPIETPDIKFNYEKFINNKNKKLLQIGWWLRRLHAIFELPKIHNYQKCVLGLDKPFLKKLFIKEKKYTIKNIKIDYSTDNVKRYKHQPNEDYDELLSCNIAFAYFYDTCANNLVLECIARNTPLLVNKVGGIEEYLGKNYPFYYSSYNEAIIKLKNNNLIKKTHEYLKNNKEINDRITMSNFYNMISK